MKKIIVCTLLSLLSISIGFTQKRSAKVEKSFVICDKTPRAERPILGVVDFNITALGASGKIGEGMSDMLSNALVECKCFRVVERERLSKIRSEQVLKGIDPTSMAQTNKLIGAQLLVMGNITEFKEKSGGAGGLLGVKIGRSLGGVGVGKTDAHVGMIIKVVDATTGEILASKSLERKVTKMGAVAGGLFGIPAGAGFFKSKAMEDAIEETILEAVELIVEEKESLPAGEYRDPVPENEITTITANNVDFNSLMSLTKFIKSLSYVKSVDKTMNGAIAKVIVTHSADTDALLTDLASQTSTALEVTGFEDSSITLKMN